MIKVGQPVGYILGGVMKRLKVGTPLFLYGVSVLVTGLLWLLLQISLPKTSFIYGFLFRAWPIQFLSSWLFLIGIFYWIQRYSVFKKEEEAFQKIILPYFTIDRGMAVELIRTMPDEYKQTLTLGRFREILQAFIYGEDIIRLNEELSRRDITEVEQGHLILNSLRNIIPIIGFLGTVIGLSLGMVKFPEVTDPVVLRTALKGFAASLSVAFDTTLLALGYTILIILLTAFLRQREEALVSKVDERGRILIGKIKAEVTPSILPEKGIEQLPNYHILNDVLTQWKAEFLLGMKEFLDKLASQNGGFAQEIKEAIKEGSKILSQKFDEIKEEIKKPPRYQVVVQPLQEKKDEE